MKNTVNDNSASPLIEMARQADLMAPACPSRQVLTHLTSRWGILVMLVLDNGTHRFSALRRTIGGVSERMLAQTLQLLERDGLIDRVAYQVVPPHVEYSLTPLGREATLRLRPLADWIRASTPQFVKAWNAAASSARPGDAPPGESSQVESESNRR